MSQRRSHGRDDAQQRLPPEACPRLEIVGTKPQEKVVFAITGPTGTYVGPPHLADARGNVSTTYRPSSTAPTGIYHVLVLGDLATGAQSDLVVEPAR